MAVLAAEEREKGQSAPQTIRSSHDAAIGISASESDSDAKKGEPDKSGNAYLVSIDRFLSTTH